MGKPRITQEQFVSRSQERHNNRYDYSEAIYTGANGLVVIKCPLHGRYTKKASLHLFGRGCERCGRASMAAANKKKNTQDVNWFLAKAKAAHGDKYDYSLIDYENVLKKIKIICPTHGVFEQAPRNHYAGAGCHSCRNDKIELANKSRRIDTVAFISRARIIHADKYDYCETVCTAGRNRVVITCPTHGAFDQRASSHLDGVGCPACGRELAQQQAQLTWLERAGSRPAFLYFVRLFDTEESFFKIGVTVDPIEKRFHAAHTNGYGYEVLALNKYATAKAAYDWEQSILETFASIKYSPKRHFVGETECFSEEIHILSCFPL